MKNYRALTKLRKQQFERAEQALAAANAEKRRLEREKEKLRADVRAIEVPGSGIGRQLGLIVSQKAALKAAIEALERRIEAADERCRQRQEDLMAAHIAYEQAKSLEAKIVAVHLAKEKRREQGRLDEIASQRFWRDTRTEEEDG